MIYNILTIIHVVVAIFMVLVVLIQGGNSGGVGAAFGGGNSSGVFGASGATSVLSKITYGAAAVFMITSLSLTVIEGKMRSENIGLKERLKATAGDSLTPETTPAEGTTAPAEEAKPQEK